MRWNHQRFCVENGISNQQSTRLQLPVKRAPCIDQVSSKARSCIAESWFINPEDTRGPKARKVIHVTILFFDMRLLPFFFRSPV